VTVCFAGGEKEAQILSSSLRMATKLDGTAKQVTDVTVQRQCEWEYIDPLKENIEGVDIVLSLACGVGVQALAERFPKAIIMPGLNTKFMGLPTEQGVWAERCAAWRHILGLTGGVCPSLGTCRSSTARAADRQRRCESTTRLMARGSSMTSWRAKPTRPLVNPPQNWQTSATAAAQNRRDDLRLEE
jgi:hypothetical protein